MRVKFKQQYNMDLDAVWFQTIHKFSASLFNSSGHPIGIENNFECVVSLFWQNHLFMLL